MFITRTHLIVSGMRTVLLCILLFILNIKCLYCVSNSSIGLVVSAAGWHYEITNFLACTLNSIGLEVHVWVNYASSNNSLQFLRLCSDNVKVLPSGDSDSTEEYAKLVETYQHDDRLKTVALVTYTTDLKMLLRLHVLDSLQQFTGSFVLVNHRSHDVNGAVTFCLKHSRCSVAHLANHVNDFALRTLFSSPNIFNSKTAPIMTLYPVYHLPALTDRFNPTVMSSRSIVFQGNTHKRDLPSIFKCINHLINDRNLTFSAKFVGKSTQPVKIPTSVQPFVEMHTGVGNDVFYQLLNNSTFLSTYLYNTKFYSYNESVATSSVPAALIAGVPVIAPMHLLRLYPCLQSAPVHRSIARESDCESMEAALSLSDSEILDLRREAVSCRNYLTQMSTQALTGLIYGKK